MTRKQEYKERQAAGRDRQVWWVYDELILGGMRSAPPKGAKGAWPMKVRREP